MLDIAIKNGYKEHYVPFMANTDSLTGTGQLPKFEEDLFKASDNLYLIPTAEVPVTNLVRDEIVEHSKLPMKFACHTPCFRSEAGSYGRDTRGMIRQHQFEKVEIVRIETPENAETALQEMLSHVKHLLESLGLQYRVLRLCGGDLGFTSALTYDFEIYSTAQKRWLEISSVSTFNSFQAERLHLRYKDEQGKKQNAHTLNGSSLALPRVIAGILENYQTPNGIEIPPALVTYTGFDQIK